MSKEHPHLGAFTLLPAAAGTCAVCATRHEPALPHNQESLHYKYYFYGVHGRWPTWDDAMAHCTPETKAKWLAAATRAGVDLQTNTKQHRNR